MIALNICKSILIIFIAIIEKKAFRDGIFGGGYLREISI